MNDKFKYLITWVDHFSKYAWCFPNNNKTRDSIVRKLSLIFIQGNPKDLQTDNGTEFTNEKVNKYLEAMEIEHTYSSPYHPQSNGSVEAFNKTIQNFLNEAYDNRISEKEEFETFQFMNYYNKKRIHTTTKQIPSIVFNTVKDIKNYLNRSKLKQRKQEKDFVKICHLKKET